MQQGGEENYHQQQQPLEVLVPAVDRRKVHDEHGEGEGSDLDQELPVKVTLLVVPVKESEGVVELVVHIELARVADEEAEDEDGEEADAEDGQGGPLEHLRVQARETLDLLVVLPQQDLIARDLVVGGLVARGNEAAGVGPTCEEPESPGQQRGPQAGGADDADPGQQVPDEGGRGPQEGEVSPVPLAEEEEELGEGHRLLLLRHPNLGVPVRALRSAHKTEGGRERRQLRWIFGGPTHDGPNVVEREREREGGGGTDLHEGLPVLCFQVPSRQPVRVPVEVQGAHHDAADFGHSLQGVPKHGLELEIVLEPAVEGGNGSFGLRVVRDEDLQSGGPADRVP